MILSTAIYAATCWAKGKTAKAIQREIAYINSMWKKGRDFQFPGNAHYQYSRMKALEYILEIKQKSTARRKTN
jgi:hypothetical protein